MRVHPFTPTPSSRRSVSHLIYESDRQLFDWFFTDPDLIIEKLIAHGLYLDPDRIILASRGPEVIGALAYELKGAEISRLDLIRCLGPLDFLRFSAMDLIDSLSTLDLGEGDLYISSLAVSHGARGMGVGFRLLEEARKIAEEEGLERLTLDVAQSNRPALKLYRKFGFRIKDESGIKVLNRMFYRMELSLI